MKKRFFSIILLLCMILTSIPFQSMAEEKGETTSKNVSELTENVSDKKKAKPKKRYTVLLIDNSGSMNGKPMERLKKTVKVFAEKIMDNEDENYIAIIPFNYYGEDIDFTKDLNQLDMVSELDAYGGTPTDRVLETANEMLSKIEDAPEYDVIKNIVVFSDGEPNDVDQTLNAAKIVKDKFYVYSVAYLQKAPLDENERNIMKKIQNAGYFEINDDEDWDVEFGNVKDKLLNNDPDLKKGKFNYPGQFNKNNDSTGVYYYSDKYFAKPSTEYNYSLATMSLILELTSWSSYNKTNWYDPAIPTDSEEYFNDKLTNLKTLLLGNPNINDDNYSGIGFKEFKANKDWEQKPTKDSIGLSAAYRLTKINDEDTAIVALVIRGGGYGSEWASNGTVGKEGNHLGFDEASNKAIEFINSYIKENKEIHDKKIKLWIVGYSRAGATANLVGGKMGEKHKVSNNISIDGKDIYCYTFATPKGLITKTNSKGNPVLIQDEKVMNTISLNDFVPRVAPKQWNFSRYNENNKKNEVIFPTSANKGFKKNLDNMLKQFETLGFDKASYDVVENKSYNAFRGFEIYEKDNNKIFNKGIRKKFEERRFSTPLIQDTVVEMLATKFFRERGFYYYNFQDPIRNYLDVVGSEGFFDLLYKIYTPENIDYLSDAVFSHNVLNNDEESSGKTYLGNNKLLRKRALEVVEKEIQRSKYNIEYIFDEERVFELADSVTKHVKNIFSSNDGIKGHEALTLFFSSLNSHKQSHYPEINLAWCMSNDINYGSKGNENFSSKARVIRINCPVDIEVINEEGNYCGGITNEIADETPGNVISFIDVTDQKTLVIPSDGSYNINIKARNDTPVNINISEIDTRNSNVERIENYFDITVAKDNILRLYAPALSDTELFGKKEGSNVDYVVNYNGNNIAPDSHIKGDNSNTKYDLNIITEGNGGYSFGEGSFEAGEFAKVEAFELPEGKFLGWYKGNQLLSKDLAYRFAIIDNTTITAKFTDVELYDVHITTTNGGNVDIPEGRYPSGVQSDTVTATPLKGYKFLRWESKDIEIEETENPELSFIIPEKKVDIKAVFLKDGNNIPHPSESIGNNENNIERIAGKNREETSVKISQKAYDKADTVILADGITMIDALTITPLSKKLSAPILLTKGSVISESVKDEITRLGAKNVIISGGPSTISDDVKKDLEGLNVERIFGKDRYSTAKEIAKHIDPSASEFIICSGINTIDAITASSLAMIENKPILLANNSMDVKDIKNVIIVGGTSSVSQDFEKKLLKEKIKVERFAGKNRFETAKAVANKVNPNAKEIIVVNAYSVADALTSQSLVFKYNAPLVLTDNKTIDIKEGLNKVYIVGGNSSVSKSIEDIISKKVK